MIYILQLQIFDIDGYANATVLAASDSPSLLGNIKKDILKIVETEDEDKLVEYISNKYTYIPNPAVDIDKDPASPENIAKDLITYADGMLPVEAIMSIIPVDYFVV